MNMNIRIINTVFQKFTTFILHTSNTIWIFLEESRAFFICFIVLFYPGYINRTLSFDEHVSNLCKKAGRKLSVLARLSSYMTLTQRRILMKSFIEAHFDFYPLVWMFHGRVLNRKINHLHECSLRILYKDSISLFHGLLQKDHSFTIRHRNIQSLAIELYKIKENCSNEIMSSIFPPRLIKYNLRGQSDFFRNSVNSSKYGLN